MDQANPEEKESNENKLKDNSASNITTAINEIIESMVNRLIVKNIDEISEQLKISDIRAVSMDIIEEASSKYLNSNVDYDLNSK